MRLNLGIKIMLRNSYFDSLAFDHSNNGYAKWYIFSMEQHFFGKLKWVTHFSQLFLLFVCVRCKVVDPRLIYGCKSTQKISVLNIFTVQCLYIVFKAIVFHQKINNILSFYPSISYIFIQFLIEIVCGPYLTMKLFSYFFFKILHPITNCDKFLWSNKLLYVLAACSLSFRTSFHVWEISKMFVFHVFRGIHMAAVTPTWCPRQIISWSRDNDG